MMICIYFFFLFQTISVINYQRDGLMTVHGQRNAPNYFPNSFSGPQECPAVRSPPVPIVGDADRYEPVNEDDFTQAGNFYRDVLDGGAKTRLVDNLIGSLLNTSNFIVERAIKNFSEADIELGKRLVEGLRKKGKSINISGKSSNL